MGLAENIDNLRTQLQLEKASPNYVEVAATMMPKRMTGIKHMLRPACRFLPMPMSLGWQENPIDDDFPHRKLIQGLLLTDIESGATRQVTAPWMHVLYQMTYEDRPFGVSRVELGEAQFTQSFDWQHLAVVCVLLLQVSFGLWGFSRREYREGAFILFSIFLQALEGYYSWVFPVYMKPRRVKSPRVYALHKGMTTTHILVLSHKVTKRKSKSLGEMPYISLEDAAVPMAVTRKGYRRILEATFRKSLQLSNIGVRLACVLSHANGLLIPLTLLIGTAASELIIAIRIPFPVIISNAPLKTAKEKSSLLDMVSAICQHTGHRSVGFVENFLPDREGNHVDFNWVKDLLDKGPMGAGVHPDHQTRNIVFSTALSRGTLRRA